MSMLKKHLLPLFMLVAVLFVPLTAWGSIVYTVVDDTYTSGSMGSVPVLASGVPGTPNKNVVTNLGGDHQVYGFRDEGNELRVLLAQCALGKSDTVWIYDALAGYKKPLKETQWSTFLTSRGVVAMGRYLYAAGQGTQKVPGKITRVDTRGDAYEFVDAFNYSGTAGYRVHAEGLVRIGGFIYVLFTEEKGEYPAFEYNNGKVVKLDADLNMIASASVGKNALTIKAHNGMLYVVSNGGPQSGGAFNSDSMIQRVNPNTMKVELLLKAGGSGSAAALPEGWSYDFRDLAFSKNGDVYVFAGAYDAEWAQFDSRIYKTTLPRLLAGEIGEVYRNTTGTGFAWAIKYDDVDDILWCAAGDRLKAFKGTDSWEFDAVKLGGNFYSFAVVDAPANHVPGDSSGGGCTSSNFPALFLLALLPLLFVRTKRERA